MKTKLTLSVDKELAQYAKQRAQHEGQSVSGMFSSFLRDRKAQVEKTATPNIAAMVGSLKRYNIDDSKAAIRSAYARKYTDRS
jgi:Family of unknown function (DUF6364)